ATTAQQDLANADCILIEGSSMAEAHPVGFRWVMKAKERGATVIHVDPRFSRTSALADIWVPMRAGGDIAFLGGLVRHIIENNLFFRDYVVHFTNASCILREDFRDAEEEATGLFSGWNGEQCGYDRVSWLYQGNGLSFPQRDRTPWRRYPGVARSRINSRFDRYSYALRYFARLPANAVRRWQRRDLARLPRASNKTNRSLAQHAGLFCQRSEGLLWEERDRRKR